MTNESRLQKIPGFLVLRRPRKLRGIVKEHKFLPGFRIQWFPGSYTCFFSNEPEVTKPDQKNRIDNLPGKSGREKTQ